MPGKPPPEKRPVARTRGPDRDARFWAVDLLIWLFAGSLGGFIAVAADFRDPRTILGEGWPSLASSGWAQMALVATLLGAMMAAARWLRRAVRRRVQVCVLLSLVVHCWLAIFLHAHELPVVRAWAAAVFRQSPDGSEPTSIPDYHWEDAAGPGVVQPLERPVETGAPEPSGTAGIEPKPAPSELPVQPPSPAPEPPLPQKPDPQPPRMAELSVPPVEDPAARQLARQEFNRRLEPPSPIPEPAIKPPTPEVRWEPDAARAEVARRVDAPEVRPEPAGLLPAEAPRPLAPAAIQPARNDPRSEAEVELAAASGPRPLPRTQASLAVLPAEAVEGHEPGPSTPAAPNQSGQPSLESRPTALEPVPTAPTPVQSAEAGVPGDLGVSGSRVPPSYLASRQPRSPIAWDDLRESQLEGGPRTLPRSATSRGLPGLPASTEKEPLPAASGSAPARSRTTGGGTGKLEAQRSSGLSGPDRELGGLPLEMASLAGSSGSGVPGGLPRGSLPAARIPGRLSETGTDEALGGLPSRSGPQRRTGPLPIQVTIRESPTPSFGQRDPSRRGARAQSFGGTEAGEAAVERGVEFLARHQFPDGRWSLDHLAPGTTGDSEGFGLAENMNGDTAATGLALLAFLGAGYTHLDGKHEGTVRRGIEWLVRDQQPDGRLFTPQTDQSRFSRSYGHAIGSIVLCEAYGMTGDPNLREPAQRAIRFICQSQDPKAGGWRYEARSASDTSVSGWMVMALKSAQMARLDVPEEVLRNASRWLDGAQADGGARYAYNPLAPDTDLEREGRRPNLPMTAEGLLMRMYLGWDRNHSALNAGARYLLENLPAHGTSTNPTRDLYYWYYATQVMFQLQGDAWKTWNGRLESLLVTSQAKTGPLAGSWDPDRPVRDRWAHAGGRIYVTALSLLMLEAPYRHLPLYGEWK